MVAAVFCAILQNPAIRSTWDWLVPLEERRTPPLPKAYHRFLINDRPAETAKDYVAPVGPAHAGGRTGTLIRWWRLGRALATPTLSSR